MWTCPECGHRFVTKNMWHSCSQYSLAYHFDRCEPRVRVIFDRFLEIVEGCGPVEVIPQKTRIAIQADVRFAGCIVRKKWLLANLWLTRKAQHAKLTRIDEFGPASFGHRFRFDAPQDMDEEFEALVTDAYAVGQRRHLDRNSRT